MAVTRTTRLLPMVVGVAALIAGLWTSLARLGLGATGVAPINHGPLMVGGFIGTVIALERAVALARPWGFLAPLLAAAGGILLVASLPYQLAAWLLLFSSLVLLAAFAVFLKRGPADFTLIMALGAVAWAIGNALLATGRALPLTVPWWGGFLVLTIAGERIELSRLRPRSPAAQRVTVGLALIYCASLFLALIDPDLGVRLGGGAMIALAAALAHGDIARRTRKGEGVARFAAICILCGYLWLIIAGLFGVVFGQTFAGFTYDAWTHSLFLGFVVVMIMAHAPIILPAVAGIEFPFTPALYLPVILLQLSLAARIGADLLEAWEARQVTGVLNIVSVLLYGLVAVRSIAAARQRSGKPSGDLAFK